MTIHEFQCELWLPVAPEELFPFFADAANLDAITPPWLNFRIVTPPPMSMSSWVPLPAWAWRLRASSAVKGQPAPGAPSPAPAAAG